jgi:serine/threonine protein kinase
MQGTGQSDLIERTIALDIRINYSQRQLGQGRFGSVWSADWRGDQVAVKEFISLHEPSWSREANIYQTCMLRHENILGFIAADIKGAGSAVRMLLVTEYHASGSLYDYLTAHLVSREQLGRFLYSTCKGLSHLHQEIIGM